MPDPLVVRPSLKMVYFTYMVAGLLIMLVLALAMFYSPHFYLVLAIPLCLDFWNVYRHIRLHFIRLSLGSGQIRYETGVLSRTTRTIELTKVQDVRVDQSLGQRILGTGDLSLESAGESGLFTIRNIDNPQKVADQILSAKRAA